MKIILISDTHGNFKALENVVLKNKNTDLFLHLGDGAAEYFKIKSIYKNLPFVMVKGNCDVAELPKQKTFNFNKFKLYACHGDSFDVKNGLDDYIKFAKNSKFNIIAYGHTHKRFIQQDENLCIINPGSLTFPRSFSASYGILTINNDVVEAKIVEY